MLLKQLGILLDRLAYSFADGFGKASAWCVVGYIFLRILQAYGMIR
jgi:hypothetical protein